MTIGIFTAMQKEAASFLQGNVTEINDGMFSIYKFKLGVQNAVLCCPPTVGEIAASAACQLLITKYNVDVVLNFGVVGALTDKTALLSTVLVGSVAHYEMDVSQIDDRAVAGKYGCFDDVAVSCDDDILRKALSARNLPVVRCASADKFVADPIQKAALNRQFGADICDMESAGVLFACKFNNVPCLLVKCVSDSLVGGANEYSVNAVKAAGEFFSFATLLAQKLC